MTVMMILTALNVVSLLHGTVLAALAMLLFRCCTINQAMNSISWRALMSLAGSIVLGTAIAKTGIAQRQGSTNSTSTPTSHTNLFGNTDKTTFFIDASVYASRPYGVRGYWLMVGRITRLYG